MIIGIIGSKGGVGKTTVVVNLAVSLMEFGKRVCIVDGNKTISNIGLHLGITDYPLTLHDALKDDVKITDAVYVHPADNIHVIPGSLSLADARTADIKTLKQKMRELEKSYDYILLDAAPGFREKSVKIMKSCDSILMVTSPELSAFTDSLEVIKFLERKKVILGGVILNRVTGKEFELSPEEISSLYKDLPIVAAIKEDVDIQKSIAMKVPIVVLKPGSSVSKPFMDLAANIVGYKEEKGLRFKEHLEKFFKFKK